MIMGKMTLDEVRRIVSELSPEDREILSDELIHERKGVDPEIEKTWVEEADKRWKDIESGKVKTIPGHVVREEARALINE